MIIILTYININISFDAYKILPLQSYFSSKKSTLNKKIMNIKRVYKIYRVKNYLNFHFKWNYIKYFECNRKNYIWKNNEYSIEEFQNNI